MLHLPYTAMVLGFVTVGAVLAPRFSWVVLAGTLAAYFLGLGVGAHWLDQLPGMGSRYVRHWNDTSLWTAGLAGVGGGVALGALGVWLLREPGLAGFVLVEGFCAVGYPLAPVFRGVFHRDAVFAISWGSLPFLTSYYAESASLSPVVLALAALPGLVAVAEIRASRRSRELRKAGATVSGGVEEPGRSTSVRLRSSESFLRLLSFGTVAAAGALLVVRLVLGA